MEAIREGQADAIAIGSIFHYGTLKSLNGRMSDYKEEGNVEFLKSGKPFTKMQSTTIKEIKEFLRKEDVEVRF